ncbi:murein biosynthesis integral membrane protein MurJ [Magnetospira sp. QH-2]|uniref:murein biosynthesis integral membrane protein MurJ n=1 Tax=Magnetospira sp. (strain QH-2) TaxID=1288970 RepID=UPI0003E8167F|nr:murein biosynthesis integral membrane protein MurJ [Magnetospira sp. QH-2]CCQ75692.1 putative Virulence factor mviN homolog protein [Magnetospira sp. QH-2]
MNLLKAFTTISGFTMMSRILGFARDILVAAILGAGMVADAFFIAFKLPNLFRRLFAEGAFNAAFVPLFAGKLEGEGEEAARRFGRETFALLLWSLLVLTLIMEIAMPWVMRAVVPGFLDDPEKFDLAVTLTRITFPYLLFISLVALLGGVLNSLMRFAAAAATPILLNLCLIAAILAATPFLPTPGHALAWGVAGAGLVQFLWLLWHAGRSGFWPRIMGPIWNDDTKLLVKRVIPGAIGAGIYQVNLVVDMIIASLLPEGSISYLFFADRMTQLPLGVIGVAVGTALLPMLARQLRAGDEAGAHNSQNRALEFTLLLTLPAAVAFAVLPEPVVVTLFQRGEFDPVAAQATAMALMAYAFGLPAYVLNKTLTPGFFARGDTATPMKIAAVAMVANVVFNLILMGPFLHVGLAMATVISAWINTALLAFFLARRGHLSLDRRFLGRLPRTLVACAGMGAALWFLREPLAPWLAGAEWERIGALAALVGAGLVSFGLLAMITGAARPSDLKSLTRKG